MGFLDNSAQESAIYLKVQKNVQFIPEVGIYFFDIGKILSVLRLLRLLIEVLCKKLSVYSVA